jgi:hypothetical protein
VLLGIRLVELTETVRFEELVFSRVELLFLDTIVEVRLEAMLVVLTVTKLLIVELFDVSVVTLALWSKSDVDEDDTG